jgi:hypothetical protein
VYGDGAAFSEAPEDEFKPRNWVAIKSKNVGLRAPLPKFPAIDLKGSWINQRFV